MKKIFVLLIFLVSTQINKSQTYSFQQFGIDKGLSQSQVMDFCQDIHGNIWFATFGGGISIFNSVNFSYFSTNEGLNSASVRKLLTDARGNIWIGTAQEIAKYDGKHITNYSCDNKNFMDIQDIVQDFNETIWFSSDSGIYKIINNQIKNFKGPESAHSIMLVDSKKNLWYSANKILLKFSLTNRTTDTIADLNVNALFEDSKHTIWIGTTTGVFCYKNSILTNFSENNILKNYDISDITEDNQSNIWITTENKGVFIKSEKQFIQLQGATGIGFDFLQCIYKDNKGNIWIGTDGAGAFLFKSFKFRNISLKETLANNFIMSVHLDHDNNQWFGTEGNGIIVYKDGKVIQHLTKENGLIDNSVYKIIQDKQQNFWFGTLNGISKYDGKSFINFTTENSDLQSNYIMTLFCDKDNNLYIGTNGKGLFKYLGGKKFINIKTNSNSIWDICQSTDGKLYVATSRGLAIISNIDTIFYTTEDGLLDNSLCNIIEDKYKAIWIASDKGITRFDGKNFINYTKKHGLTSDIYYHINFDKQGNLIAGNVTGFDKIKFSANWEIKSVKHFGKSEGFLGVECNLNSIAIDSTGLFYFGTMNGITIFDSQCDQLNTEEPSTHITEIKLFYQPVDWKNIADSIQLWSNLPVDLKLDYKQNNLTFHFSGIDFQNPEKVVYKYYLEGFDEKWTPVTKLNYATYSNIPPGKYIFKVLAANSDEVWNTLPAIFEFEIKPPFWQKIWFIIFCIVIVFLGFITIFNLRTRRLREAKKKLEYLVTQRTAEINQQKEEIRAQRDEIEAQKVEIESQRDLATKQRDEISRQQKNITDSILYAQRIQNAFLPPESLVKSIFPEHFIIYHPRNIVSGDFYWIKKIDEFILFAVGDCTGHGVPGAFMSLLSGSLLNEICRNHQIRQSNQVLEMLKEQIINTLHQVTDSTVSKDGLDLAFCSLNKNNMELQYAGAYIPLYITRMNPDKNEFEFIEIKANKMPIGVYFDIDNTFTNNTIQLYKKDSLYLLTDGITDQFGGSLNKKFLVTKMKNLIVAIQSLTLQQQKDYINQVFLDWKGERNQLDDVLIWGISIT